MSITSKIRIARGLRADLPVPPNSFEIGRPYFCKDTGELFVGEGETLPMKQVMGLAMDFLGVWDSGTDYSKSDLVVFNNELYVAVNANLNSEPDTNPSDWQLLDFIAGPPGPKGDKGDTGDAG